jgi:hypothetical protein
MSNEFKLPAKRAVIYWPVATGDSTTLVLKPGELVMQIDLHHLEKAEDEESPEWSIVDELVRILPKKNNRPYLALFVLSHPDEDHITGFAELLKKVQIGEIWHTPRIFRDQKDQETLCEDAKAFRKEAHRRRKAILASPSNIKCGDRMRVIGHDDILNEDDYKGLPSECKSRPSDVVSKVDGNEISANFNAFIHAPFKEDQAASKNNTSLALNVTLSEGQKSGQFFFFGDREYRTTKQIFEVTEERKNESYLNWNVTLCPHHCSKGVMYAQLEGEDEVKFRRDIMDYFEKYSQQGYFVSSSCADFTDGEGDDPPHKRARQRYEEIVDAGHFICTHEYPNKEKPQPLVFVIDGDGFHLDDQRPKGKVPVAAAAAVQVARGATRPPGTQVGFGIL